MTYDASKVICDRCGKVDEFASSLAGWLPGMRSICPVCIQAINDKFAKRATDAEAP